MKEQSRLAVRVATRLAAASLAVAGVGAFGGCLNRPIEPIQPLTTSVVVEQLTQSGVNKIDLLLAIDNSSSMADKQQILAIAVPDLMNGLLNPPCVDNSTGAVTSNPTDPTVACPSGNVREFTPITDVHVGLISSSLGTFGANGCPDTPPASCPNADTTPLDDHGHLVTRSDSCDSQGPVPTYQSEGFLAWDPKQVLSPPGIGTLGALGPCTPEPGCSPPFGTSTGIIGSLHDLVVGNGQEGCGFESQNESWYRFLVDPNPYGTVMPNTIPVVTSGTDTALLKQRAEFLRPDSLLAIVLLSDETDVSIKEYSSYPLFADPSLHLPHATSACAQKGPLDPCCVSCGQPTPKGCSPDPLCTSDPNYTNADENTAIRAFGLIHHKTAYGIEFFYQPSRYVSALTSTTIVDENGKTVPNPIYSNLNPSVYKGSVRDPSLVFYAAITGVPWQLIARQNKGVPDLINGVSDLVMSGQTADSTQIGGFKTYDELAEPDPTGTINPDTKAKQTYWDDIAGNPEQYIAAKSPFMQESTVPRTGTDPITGAAIAPPTTANGAGTKIGSPSDPLNDHEWTIATPPADIEYACIFPLLSPRDESSTGAFANTGDCASNPADNPLCSPNPNDSGKNTLQTSAKGYPGIKHLAIAKGMQDQGIVASICPAQLTDNTKGDFGYRPAVNSIINRLKQALKGECLPRQLTENTQAGPSQGQVACLILEGTNNASCNCDGTARQKVDPSQQAAVTAAQETTIATSNNLNCFCEITQLCNAGAPDCTKQAGADLQQCQNEAAINSGEDGWCYIDASVNSQQANLVETVAKCPADAPHTIRFVGAGNAATGSTLFITCSGD